MYLKTRNTKTTTPFHLNTKTVRVPYENCHFCDRNIKDWGGKKHLMNPLGSCLSDVWRDLPNININDHIIPRVIKSRIIKLTKFKDNKEFKFLYLKEDKNIINKKWRDKKDSNQRREYLFFTEDNKETQIDIKKPEIKKNVILHTDAIEYMKKMSRIYPNGFIDLFFADPPYNLEKDYNNYDDDLRDKEYLEWCKEWLKYGIKILKPGATLMILNLPKWSIELSNYLLKHLEFRHWIVWDAMSVPAGKLMPAHYSLLYFTKPGGKITFNYNSKFKGDLLSPIDSDIYCLRKSCISERKRKGDNKKIPLTDVWWDIHRIKHKKDRDNHPCQLPIKLMKRIINLTTNENDLIFDPFSGAGTTSITAKMLNRNYISTEIDTNYVKISKRNLSNIRKNKKQKYLIRKSVKRSSNKLPKNKIEIKYIKLCLDENRIIKKDELEDSFPILSHRIKEYYPSFKNLKKIAKRRLEINANLNKNETKTKEKFKEISEFF
jgi:site-specific DNA-methyltransferase (adenine-specific)